MQSYRRAAGIHADPRHFAAAIAGALCDGQGTNITKQVIDAYNVKSGVPAPPAATGAPRRGCSQVDHAGETGHLSSKAAASLSFGNNPRRRPCFSGAFSFATGPESNLLATPRSGGNKTGPNGEKFLSTCRQPVEKFVDFFRKPSRKRLDFRSCQSAVLSGRRRNSLLSDGLLWICPW